MEFFSVQNPIPGTTREKNGEGYEADSGLDILVPVGTPCFAAADGTVIYSEPGHTPWNKPPDTANSVLILLKEPFSWRGITYYYIWYTHLSKLAHHYSDGSSVSIKAGDPVGWTGIGNSVPHLHFGILVDRGQTNTMPVSQVCEVVYDNALIVDPTKKIKLFTNGSKTILIVDGKEVSLKEVKLDDVKVDSLELVKLFKNLILEYK